MSATPAAAVAAASPGETPAAHVRGVAPIAVALCLSVTGVLMFKVLPLIVGAAAESFHFGPSELGLIASSDLAGITLASLLAPFWARRIDWRIGGFVALAIVVVGNLVSAGIGALPLLLAVRVLTGVGEGMASSLALVILSDTRNPDRAFGLAVGAPIFVGLIAFQLMPPLVERFGYDGVVLSLAALAGAFALLTPLLPARGRPVQSSNERPGPRAAAGLRPVAVGLAAAAVYHVGLGAVWAFIERMGVAAGLASETIGASLGVAVVFGLAGSMIATAVGARFGRSWPLVLAISGQCAALLLLHGSMSATQFTLAACAFQLLWLLSVPYQLAVIASFDTSGRYFVLALAFQAAGVTLGPVVAGLLIDGQDFAAVRELAAVCLAASLALILPLARRSSRTAEGQL